MDYTNDPDGGAGGAASDDLSNEHPNQHDFDQLMAIYGHSDSGSTGPGKPGGGGGGAARNTRGGRVGTSDPVQREQPGPGLRA